MDHGTAVLDHQLFLHYGAPTAVGLRSPLFNPFTALPRIPLASDRAQYYSAGKGMCQLKQHNDLWTQHQRSVFSRWPIKDNMRYR